MAENDNDERVSAGYRGLGVEEPPRALDEAILAAARRRPSRWRVPLSVAAVLVLAVGVTLRMQPTRPDAESVALAPQVMETPRPAPAASAPAPAMARAPAQRADAAVARAPAERRMRSEAAPLAKLSAAPLTPEAWLERIAELRKQGRSKEADDSLAEFRKRYPDYRIPETAR